MDAAIGSIPVGRAATPPLISSAAFQRGFAVFASSLLALVAAILVSRRIAGALVEPLSTIGLMATGTFVVAVAIAIRRWSQRTTVRCLLSGAVVLTAFAVSLPGSSWFGVTMLWLLVIGEEIWVRRPVHRKSANRIDVAWRHVGVDLPKDSSHKEPTIAGVQPPSGGLREDPANWPSSGGSLPPAIDDKHEPLSDWTNSTATQQLRYNRNLEGGMSVEGWLRAEFAAGQRTATVHAAFCPAFSALPQVEAEPLDGPDCDIRPMLTLPWGIRWDVKLDRAANEPTSVVLGFIAAET
jgi:hypothetical protein